MSNTDIRRSVMNVAWGFFRTACASSEARGFGDCLRAAWAWSKRLAVSAGRVIGRALRSGGTVQLKSMVFSPIARGLSGQPYAGAKAYRAAYTTARLGH